MTDYVHGQLYTASAALQYDMYQQCTPEIAPKNTMELLVRKEIAEKQRKESKVGYFKKFNLNIHFLNLHFF